MEQVRLLLAIVLSLLVFLVWNYFFVEPPQPQKVQNEKIQQEENVEPDIATGEESVQPSAEIKSSTDSKNLSPLPAIEDGPARIIAVETSKYTVKFSEDGASIISFVLKDYFETVGHDADQKELISQNNNIKNLTLFFENNSNERLSDKRFKAISDDGKIQVKNKDYELKFVTNTSSGLQIEKKFTFKPDSYLIDLEVTVKNLSGNIFSDQLGLSLSKFEGESKKGYVFEGPSALIDGKHEQVKIKKNKVPDVLTGEIQWIAFEDRYFISSIISKNVSKSNMRVRIKENVIFNQYLEPTTKIAAGDEKKFQFAIFFGPKKQALLKNMDYSLSRVIDFGFFDFLAKPFLWFMNFIYSFLPNYGVAIIILTLLTKILLWPLGNKSYKSMNEMKRLQPIMEEIREKYKNDKNKMNQEIMGLYRTYKINPMGGCLPMILQIPVFLALYRMLYQAIELRHAPFIWWINDLSAPDRLLRFDFSIPFMQPPYGIPVLTIIMGATMLLQQKMSPPPGDPAQAKMMMIMPVVFTFIFINFSSGLVLYWLVNNILSIGQQYYIQKKYA